MTTEHPRAGDLGAGDRQVARVQPAGGPFGTLGFAHHPEPEVLHGAMAELNKFLMVYKFGLAEIETKINILAEELAHRGRGNPIEHVTPRLKSLGSITAKARRLNCPLHVDDLRTRIRDIAGIRIVCGFVPDVYTVARMLTRQPDVHLVVTKDYIAQPKANGYRSLHLIVEIPVFLSDQVVAVPVEVQLRTVAMDFWASLEHKIYYKHDADVPAALRAELAAAAEDAARLDERMQRLHHEIHGPRLIDGDHTRT
ncbi:GTP pyrophosphokinase [Actinoplanes ianthinogenes]|uniref:GTP pyrophosphokinase n=1 Tax=Actinoplanes ianthinogenes TaxID=122358 RepID=A0ABM7LJI1_9ACTN|nr:GTP pyrophosphokinase [Actinoplanes ianthinogenes]GGR36356.1 GTP pyrophosphokinase [Actinoplanes ianthinogenes]